MWHFIFTTCFHLIDSVWYSTTMTTSAQTIVWLAHSRLGTHVTFYGHFMRPFSDIFGGRFGCHKMWHPFFFFKKSHIYDWRTQTKLRLNETQKQLREVNLSTIWGPVSRWGLVRIRGPVSSWSSWGPVSVFFGRIFTTNTIFRVISVINTPHLRWLQENHTSQGFEVGRVRSEIKACFERAHHRIPAMYGSRLID